MRLDQHNSGSTLGASAEVLSNLGRKNNAIIIGAGPGGLATAMLLASRGVEVDLYERADQVGGRTSIMDIDGFKFDRGPTFFLFPEVLEGIFEECGRSLHEEVDLIRLDPNYRLVFEQGGFIDAACDIEKTQAEVAKISPEDANGLERYVAENRDKLEAFRPILEQPFLSHMDVLKLPLASLMPLLRPWNSVDKDLKRYFSDPRIRLAFSFQSKYLGMSPFRCPSLFTILAFLEYEYGVFHPVGGCGAVTEAMARVAREMGVRIHLDTPVRRVIMDGKRATGILTDNGEHSADALVINADFARAMESLVPNHVRKRWTDKKLEKKKYSCSTFMMYLGIEGHYDDLAHHTIYLAEGYEQHLQDIEKNYRLTENPSFYVQNPCITDPSMAPDGHSTLYVLVPVPHMHESIDWGTAQARFREQTLDQLEQRLGLEGLRERVRVEHCITPRDWEGEMNLYRGATFSLAHGLDQMLSLRPRNRFEDLEGVYLTGGGTHPGSGLPVIFQSAQITADLMTEDLQLEQARAPQAHIIHSSAPSQSSSLGAGLGGMHRQALDD